MSAILSYIFRRLTGNIISNTNATRVLRCYSNGACTGQAKKGLVLGAYDDCGQLKFTNTAKSVNESLEGKLEDLLKGYTFEKGKVHVLYNVSKDYAAIAVAGLGGEKTGINGLENLNEHKENIRIAAGLGAMRLQDDGCTSIFVEEFTNAEAAAEGAALGTWQYQELKSKETQKTSSTIDLFHSDEKDAWKRGIIKAEAQNIARRLEEAPPNLMTPSIFAKVKSLPKYI